MSAKTRYLQISETVLLEYLMNDENYSITTNRADGFLYTRLMDGHYAVISPLECELEQQSDGSHPKYRPVDDILSINTLHHLAVPMDLRGNKMYSFIDINNQFSESSVMREISPVAFKALEYTKYCRNPRYNPGVSTNEHFEYVPNAPKFDKVRLYFVNGYNIRDTFGILAKISVRRNDGAYLDLCNLLITKANLYTMMHYMLKPIIFGNFVYDRYIDIDVLSLYGIMEDSGVSGILDIDQHSPVYINFSYVDEENVRYDAVSKSMTEIIEGDEMSGEIQCVFTKSVSLKGVIPVERMNSDNLGIYIAEDPNSPFIQFYGTWKKMPLTFEIVQHFNRSIELYDKSLIRSLPVPYEVGDEYEVDVDLKKWIAIHEIECSFLCNDMTIKDEKYTMSQTFESIEEPGNEITKFYYRPIVFDSDMIQNITSIALKYTMRFVNVFDRVQFVKSGSLSLTNINKFYANGTDLRFGEIVPYKIYNRIVEPKQSIATSSAIGKTKYVKVFYNSTDVVLTDGEADYSNGQYTLTLSGVPKTYKFVFKNRSLGGSVEYMDLTNAYYKLYVRNSGTPIIVEPTYSSNMNLNYGEIEFNLSPTVISRLMGVEEGERVMSVVAYNEDNSISSMFDMRYEFV